MSPSPSIFNIPSPNLQVDFSSHLRRVRGLYLQDALAVTVSGLNIAAVDGELNRLVPAQKLAEVASYGLRGELVFAVPCILQANPRLLGYYRLLLGYSQKEFYTGVTGASPFKTMEEKGRIPVAVGSKVEALCKEMIVASCFLLDGIGPTQISREFLDDLTLLTLGPQLRGGRNVAKGSAAIVQVFNIIESIVRGSIRTSSPNKMTLMNAAGRKVFIEFSADPDIIIREEMTTGAIRNIIAIEVKGGEDFSNIHNRIGEAEKSHQKARQDGYLECWTIVNVDRMDGAMARRESPTTNRFFRFSQLGDPTTKEYSDFCSRIISLTGITI